MQKKELYDAAALTLIRELDNDDLASIEDLGLTNDVIAALATLDVNEKIELVRHASKYMKLSIDIDALERQINRIENLRDDRELENYFLIKYAPFKLMNSLFGMHATEFSHRRKRLGVDGKSGRPNYCDEETEALVWNLWKQSENLELKERYIKTAELSNQNIDTVWSILQRYEFGNKNVG